MDQQPLLEEGRAQEAAAEEEPAHPAEKPASLSPAAAATQTLRLDRTSDVPRSLGYILLFLVMEVSKQMSSFGLSRVYGGHYPLPPTVLVFLTEFTKLLLVFTFALATGSHVRSWRLSLKFTVPAGCYFVTNLLYLAALTVVPPPVWMVLIQGRTLYTAAAYVLVFRRKLHWWQLAGCGLVVASMPIAKASELSQGGRITTTIFLMSQVCAILSTVASLVIELLLKNDPRSLEEQQTWLYLLGSTLAFITVAAKNDFHVLFSLPPSSAAYCTLMVVCSSLAGLCVPQIIRNLDTIAKDYLGAINNVVLTLVTALLFPASFAISWTFLLSLGLLVAGIVLYEKT